jgi:hypothetical protein
MGCGDGFTEGKDEDAWLRRFVRESEIPDDEEFRRTGIHFAADQERVGLAAFAAAPEAHPLSTPSGTVELSGTACVAAGLSAVPEARVQAQAAGLPLRLVTPTAQRRVHSQLACEVAYMDCDRRQPAVRHGSERTSRRCRFFWPPIAVVAPCTGGSSLYLGSCTDCMMLVRLTRRNRNSVRSVASWPDRG